MTKLAEPPDLVLAGRFELGEERRYRHVPFVVPPGVRQLHLGLAYDDRIDSDPTLSGGNTLDLGLFDERGAAAGGPGFRGWSGSELLEVVVGEEWATPPYRPGPIGAGIWQALLGPYKVGPRGLTYRLEVRFDPGLPAPPPPPLPGVPPRPALPPPAEPGWLRGDLHCHTRHSDGDSWPAEMLAQAAGLGLDFLAITDHNAAIPPVAPDLPNLPLLISGVEVTTYRGHWNAWGVAGWFDFRDTSDAGTEAAMRAAVSAGCMVSVNHPKPFGPPWEHPPSPVNHAVEAWNGYWGHLNPIALAYWETRLRAGERLIALGGSDTHHLRPGPRPLPAPRLGMPTTWVQIEGPPSAAAVLAGLRAGRCFLSATPAGPQLYLERVPDEAAAVRLRAVGAPGQTLMLLTEHGCIHAQALPGPDITTDLRLAPDAVYLRAQIVDAVGNVLALSNPIWPDAE